MVANLKKTRENLESVNKNFPEVLRTGVGGKTSKKNIEKTWKKKHKNKKNKHNCPEVLGMPEVPKTEKTWKTPFKESQR